MHRHDVELLVAEEAAALQAALGDGIVLRLEQRGTDLVAELPRAAYAHVGHAGYAVPLLGQRRETSIVLVLHCENYDTDPPSVEFFRDWATLEALQYAEWPKGPGVVERHYATGKPFVCRPGVREYHSHVQHGDVPWDRLRGLVRPRQLLVDLARDLVRKNVRA
jgi:hypothetical protein